MASWEDLRGVEHAGVAVQQHSYGDVGALNGAFEQHVGGVVDGVDGVDEVDGVDGVDGVDEVDCYNNNPRNCLGNIH